MMGKMSGAVINEPVTANVPALRFGEFLEPYVFQSVKDTFSFFNGYAFSSNDAVSNGCRWLKIADVGIQVLEMGSQSFLPNDFQELHQKFVLDEGDYVVALTRPILRGSLKIARIDSEYKGALLNQRVGKLVSSENLSYVYFLLQKQDLINKIANTIAGTDPPNLSTNEIGSIEVFISGSLEEQQKIANFLSAVDSKLNTLEKTHAALNRYKRGLMQQLFSQTRRFKDDNGQDFPDWEEKRLGELAHTTTGDSNRQDSSNVGEYAFFDRSDDIRRSERYLFEGEAIIVAGEGQNFIPKYYSGKFDLHQRTYATMSFNGILGKFLFYYMNYHRFYFNKVAVGSTVPSLRLPMFEAFPISLPNLKEQQKIAQALSTLDNKITAATTKITQLKTFKKGLLQQMFV